MIIEYSKIKSGVLSEETLQSVVEINIDKKQSSSLTKGGLEFRIDYTGSDSGTIDQILKYSGLVAKYYILSVRRDRLIKHFGLTKISGTVLYLIDKVSYDKDVGEMSEDTLHLYAKLSKTALHSHIGFLSDDCRLFTIKENYRDNDNRQLNLTKPIKIIDPITIMS